MQLFAGDDNDNFMDALSIEEIPRYILVNPEGIIDEIILPRPFDPKFEFILDKKLKKVNVE